jgi:hypothetical protein
MLLDDPVPEIPFWGAPNIEAGLLEKNGFSVEFIID